MLKNESARNQTKPVPLRPSRRPESGGIIFIANGVRMRKISRSVRKVKQANLMLTGQDTWHVRTVLTWQDRTDDVADRTEGHVASPGRATCHTDLAFSGYSWTNKNVTRVTTHRVTRGMLTSAC
jgi:hypothetical protein